MSAQVWNRQREQSQQLRECRLPFRDCSQLWLFQGEPWDGQAPRSLTRARLNFKFPGPTGGSIQDAPWSFKVPEGDPLQLEMLDGESF